MKETTPDYMISDEQVTQRNQRTESATRTADRAHDAALRGDHAAAEELYLLAAAKASAADAVHTREWAKGWDKDAARQRRLAAIQKVKP